jgi:pimeloyl-ACP methyl ester carboxylesterase/DNA-binding SARP family transcriptional activator
MSDRVPQVHFARAEGANIAYQVFGSGPPIVAIPPMAQNIELAWEWPAIRAMFERFASFSRYLHFDKRGTGASDRTIPVAEMDQRVEDLRAVMDDAGIDRAHLFGTSEGGPMALLFAATYPDRAAGVILEASAARLGDSERPEPIDAERLELMLRFVDGWGTPESTTADLFAPSLAANAEFRAWHERYERQSATRDALRELLHLNALMDVRDVLADVTVPVLMLHRTDDVVVPVRYARETAAALPDARLIERPGADHFTYAADTEALLTEIERFVTGRVIDRAPLRSAHVEIETLGRFRVLVDGVEIEAAQWGSRRARQLLKRLVVARGWPVTRDELTDILWPDEDDERRLRPRLSVQLSAVRRILGGGVVADRSSVRLDLDRIDVDLARFYAAGTDAEIVATYRGELLPDDRFEGWTEGPRAEAQNRFVAAADRRMEAADDDADEVVGLAGVILAADPFHDGAHRTLIRSHLRAGRPAAAAEAHQVYVRRLAELGIDAEPIDEIESS